ncbi:hypothetical protein C4K14_4067 [Pseudomonas chlororaphis subsp. aureofaciens]|uniref:hypothetical protein n=1 Tax=Pseudomonas chlororaphis TaxID=587753 RepID=UPI000F55F66A|nr:hypothetical protein [Pseudomonas chlororaphis]AZD86889.1 hypothetical protein C4K14_4067 [Pseudomonas chlororaphis subsp. aureofaciens]
MPIPPRHPGAPHKRLIRVIALWTSLLILLAFTANIIGIYLIGGIVAWSNWLDDHKLHFFVWRLFLYAASTAGWLWARRRLLQRDPESRLRVRFMEQIALPLALLIELSQWINL